MKNAITGTPAQNFTSIQIICTSFNEANRHGYLIYDFLALRKQIFVDRLNWKIPHDEMVEMDQYDCDKAKYILALYKGAVVGGVRLLPTTNRSGKWTFMADDAQKYDFGFLPGSLGKQSLKNPNTWEGTRLVICQETLRTSTLRRQCLEKILYHIKTVLAENNSKYLVTISNVSLERVLSRFGFSVSRIARAFTCTDDKKRYALYITDFFSSHNQANA